MLYCLVAKKLEIFSSSTAKHELIELIHFSQAFPTFCHQGTFSPDLPIHSFLQMHFYVKGKWLVQQHAKVLAHPDTAPVHVTRFFSEKCFLKGRGFRGKDRVCVEVRMVKSSLKM